MDHEDDDPPVPLQVTIDLRPVNDIHQLHTVLRRELNFPSWTGRNWDAFNDVINGMIELPADVTLVGWSHLVTTLTQDARILRELLDRYEERHFGSPGWEARFRYEE
jgi:RNAse (barnase) inhibitor barstar